MQLFTNKDINTDNVTKHILPYINIIEGYNTWSDDEVKSYIQNEKKFYYIAPYISRTGDFRCNDKVFSLSFRLDGKVKNKAELDGLMYIVDSGHTFTVYQSYHDYEYFCAVFPLYIKGEYCGVSTGDDYIYFKAFDNEQEASEALAQWNLDNKTAQEDKKKTYIINEYNRLIAQEREIHEQIMNLVKQYSFLPPQYIK